MKMPWPELVRLNDMSAQYAEIQISEMGRGAVRLRAKCVREHSNWMARRRRPKQPFKHTDNHCALAHCFPFKRAKFFHIVRIRSSLPRNEREFPSSSSLFLDASDRICVVFSRWKCQYWQWRFNLFRFCSGNFHSFPQARGRVAWKVDGDL